MCLPSRQRLSSCSKWVENASNLFAHEYYREKEDLLNTMHKLKQMVNELRDRESDAAKKVKNSLDIVEQMQVEKAQVHFL